MEAGKRQNILKYDPECMFDEPPIRGGYCTVNGPGQQQPPNEVIQNNDHSTRSRDTLDVSIEGEERQGSEDVKCVSMRPPLR